MQTKLALVGIIPALCSWKTLKRFAQSLLFPGATTGCSNNPTTLSPISPTPTAAQHNMQKKLRGKGKWQSIFRKKYVESMRIVRYNRKRQVKSAITCNYGGEKHADRCRFYAANGI